MAGWFDFVNGQTLPASRVQDYLMDQSVMVFADDAARTAALPSPTFGMVTYLTSTGELYVRTGGFWRPIVDSLNYGRVLPPRRNVVINGGFDIWQRGSSFTSPSFSQYTADRWKNNNYNVAPTTYSITRETFAPGTAPSGSNSEFFYRSTIATVGGNTEYDTAQQRIEDVRTFANQTVTLSFWAKADSARTVTPAIGQVFGHGGSAGVTVLNYGVTVFNLTTAWQRFSATVSIPSITGKTIGAGSYLWFAFRQASASGSVLDLSDIQLELGSVATPFVRAASTLQGELAACQRYYTRFSASAAYSSLSLQGFAASTTLALLRTQLPVTMRIAPTAIDFSTLGVLQTNGVDIAVSSAALSGRTTANSVEIETTSTGLTSDRGYALIARNSSSAFIGFSAEL